MCFHRFEANSNIHTELERKGSVRRLTHEQQVKIQVGSLRGKQLHPTYPIASAALGNDQNLVPKQQNPSIFPARPLTPNSLTK